jgi:histidinol-phosphate/aromatic aminotransferase/cobyric acid decarboxylase-like protein
LQIRVIRRGLRDPAPSAPSWFEIRLSKFVRTAGIRFTTVYAEARGSQRIQPCCAIWHANAPTALAGGDRLTDPGSRAMRRRVIDADVTVSVAITVSIADA